MGLQDRGPVDGGAGAAEVLRRRGVEGKEECGRRAARATRAMEDGILTQLVVYVRPIPRGAPESPRLESLRESSAQRPFSTTPLFLPKAGGPRRVGQL